MTENPLLLMREYAIDLSAKVEGWLQPSALMMIWGALERQHLDGISGHVMEIGVFKGRTFLLLCRSLVEGERAIAVDPFDLTFADGRPRDFGSDFRDNLARLAPGANVELIEAPSRGFLDREIAREIAGEVRFLSIDGSHEKQDVLGDLEIAEHCLSSDGLIAIDDFMSPYDPDVTAAVFDYLDRQKHPPLVPVATCVNYHPMLNQGGPKLFMARPDRVAYYQNAMNELHPDMARQKAPLGGHDVLTFAFTVEPFKRRVVDYDAL